MDGMQAHTRGAVSQDEFFGGFTFSGNQSLEVLAEFYGLSLPGLDRRISLGNYLKQSCYGVPRSGYRMALGHAELCVLEVEEGVVTKVGLRPLSSLRRAVPHNPARYHIGDTLLRSRAGFRAAAAQ
jgi:NhaP-type Na+/H+ and K+/H+ antiporter